MYGFDQEYSVIIRDVPDKLEIEEVKRAFTALDEVVRVQPIDSLPDTILCQFSESITPMLLDNEHAVGDSHWEIIQIDEFTQSQLVSEPL